MATRDDDYWLERNKEKLDSISDIVDRDIKDIVKVIERGNQDLTGQINTMYMKYGKDNGLSYPETLKYLTSNERKEFQKDLKYYIDKYQDTEYVQAHKQELQSLSVRARVQRIEEMQVSITKVAESLHSHLNGASKDSLGKVFDDSYYRTAHATSGTGISKSFTIPNVKDVEEVLKTPWSGKNYSEKIWNITDTFASRLKTELTRGLIQGKHPDEIARSWRKLNMGKDGAGGTVYECKRLMETEAANISEQASKKYYEDAGVEGYRYLTSGHANVCEDCADLQKRSNEKVFLVKDAVSGVNYAPMHPFCHCTSIPATKYDDEDEAEFDMPYDEWRDKYIKPMLSKEAEYQDMVQGVELSKKLRDFLEQTKTSLRSGKNFLPGESKVVATMDIDFKDDVFNDKLIKSFAKEYADSKIENAMVLSPNNKAYLISGTTGNVNVLLAGQDLFGSKVIHNHPEYYGMIGDNFSREDFELFFDQHLNELYVKNGKGLYRLKSTKRITDIEAKRMYTDAMYKYQDSLTDEVPDDIQYQTMLQLDKENDWLVLEEVNSNDI